MGEREKTDGTALAYGSPKFIQIAGAGNAVYALDEDGDVWVRERDFDGLTGWRHLPARRFDYQRTTL